MAMAGLHNKGNSNGNRSGNKPYGMMLLLAFGAALLGVMMIHKLRERRIFNLLVQEKDHQLISLQLLLQKEREYTKEMKRKAEEMKSKIYSLRNQNMETDRKIQEMQSTIQSLKDERKILESALEERQNDIQMSRKKNIRQEKENTHLSALVGSLKQKEAEIEDLKRHLETSRKRWSAGSDNDLLNRKLNFNVTEKLADSGMRFSQSKAENGELQESTNYSNGVNFPDRGADALASILKSENSGKLQNASENKGSLGVNEENSLSNATGARVEPFQKLVRSAFGQDHTVAIDEQMRLKNSDQDEAGGLKLKMAGSSKTSGSSMKEKHAKENTWRKVARNRRLVNSRNDEDRKRNIPVDKQNELRDREEGTTYNNKNTDEQRVTGVTDQLEDTKPETITRAKLGNSWNPEVSKDTKNIPVIEHTVQHLQKLKVIRSLDGETTGTRSNAMKESSGINIIQHESQENKNRDMKMQKKSAHENTANKDEMQEESEDADVDDGADMGTGEFYRELLPDLEDKEEYKEETEEPEF